jgi:hypothetical protein
MSFINVCILIVLGLNRFSTNYLGEDIIVYFFHSSLWKWKRPLKLKIEYVNETCELFMNQVIMEELVGKRLNDYPSL